jgi:hypothetical protein
MPDAPGRSGRFPGNRHFGFAVKKTYIFNDTVNLCYRFSVTAGIPHARTIGIEHRVFRHGRYMPAQGIRSLFSFIAVPSILSITP